jgi:hypothetical protein
MELAQKFEPASPVHRKSFVRLTYKAFLLDVSAVFIDS